MALEIENLFSKKLEKMKKTTICHCRTTMVSTELKFEWTLENFSKPSKSSITFKATGITHYYQALTVNMSFNVAKNMIYFHTWFMAEKKKFRVNYYIYTVIKGKILYPCEVNGIYLTQNMRVYEISLNKIEEDVSVDPTCDSLTVYVCFDIIESVSNHFFQTIIDESEESAIDKFALDKRSGVKVNFLANKKCYSIDKGLLYSKSDNFKNIFYDPSGRSIDTIRIYRLPDVFEYFVYYLETSSLDKLIVRENANICDVYERMEIRLFFPGKYDKIRETLCNLLKLAKANDLKGLVLLCENFLIKTMHRVDVLSDLSFGQNLDSETVEKYTIKLLKLHCYNMSYFADQNKELYRKLVKENFNCHKMSFITEEYDPDTFNVKS
ncbi:uncharacterized protein LOC126853111 [Cataglyphis hispanica]|uniref:uncharacterized protein LOC126853111 n=1 Tax=Cataglyphis hispanica TaxID=1086592 RepID=UPI00217F9881|nr:uncharacterized protein LOC126853111 [Cataglyphis hispanica]